MDTPETRGRRALRWLSLAALAAGLAYLLIGEHRVHAMGWLPFLFLLACPLLHMTMHGGHGGHAGRPGDDPHPGHDERGPSGRSRPY